MGGLIKLWGPSGPLNCKEYTAIQTPKGPIILINPHMNGLQDLEVLGISKKLG